MIPEQVQKRIMIFLVVLVLIAGSLFVIFAVFINRGKLIISAQAPYLITIEDFKTVNCITNRCEIILAPKRYTFSISKEGYEKITRETEVPMHGEKEEQVDFSLIPDIKELKAWNPVILPEQAKSFTKKLLEINLKNTPDKASELKTKGAIKNIWFSPQGDTAIIDDGKTVSLHFLSTDQSEEKIENIDIPSGTVIFYHPLGKSVVFLETNKDNFKQTLYQLELIGEKKKIPLTTFIRSITNYFLVLSPDLKKIALIDQTKAEENSIYILDLEKKKRDKILDFPLITGFKWLDSSTSDFLIENRKEKSFTEEISFWDNEKKVLTPLSIHTNLSNIALKTSLKNSQILIIAEKAETSNLAQSEAPETDFSSSEFSFFEYALDSGQKKLLKTVKNMPFPEKTELTSSSNDDNKTTELLFLSNNKVYSLKY